MKTSIQLLPETTINQIAAGEVIEDPSSVIKELVENAIDAKASEIHIEIQGGGLQKIRVSDNGMGMNKADALLSFQRHATSKINTFEDLSSLQTMGFRGEALASIAAISKMVIETATEQDVGSQVSIEGGHLHFIKPIARKQGTTIEVRSLFFNVPARKKFQKSIKVITTQVIRNIHRLALGFPDIGFSFSSSSQPLLHSPSYCNEERAFERRIEDILGEKIFSFLLPFSIEDKSVKLSGFIGKPSYIRKNRLFQYLFVNSRSVYSRSVEKAVREGYGTRINPRDFPLFILYFDVPSKYIDVNVHPQKKEIRFQEEMPIFDIIRKGISNSLSFERYGMGKIFNFPAFDTKEYKPSESIIEKNKDLSNSLEQSTFQSLNSSLFQSIEFIGSYLLVRNLCFPKNGEYAGYVLVDLERALCNCLFESFASAFKEGCVIKQSQTLATPILLDVSFEEIVLVETWLKEFLSMGLEIRILGEKTLCVDAIPFFISPLEVENLLQTMLDELVHCDRTQRMDEVFLKKMAYHFSHVIKARKSSFNKEQAEKILHQLLRCRDPLHDALGQPIMVFLDSQQIHLLFKKRGGK